MIFVVAILETMWGNEAGQAARYFRISKDNFSGRRLYTLCGPTASLLVTNACPQLVTSAKEHGIPDPAWLKENLLRIMNFGAPIAISRVGSEMRKIDVILACGKIAQKTLEECEFLPAEALGVLGTRVLYVPHPAARNTWTLKLIAEVQWQIQHGTAPFWPAVERKRM